MDASDGAAAVQISTETQRASFPEAARAPNVIAVAKCEEKVDDPSLPASKKFMEGESYGSKSLFAGEELVGSTRNNRMVEESYGSSRLLAEDANTVGVTEESYESRRLLLSCSMASARVKKKRRSRASSKAPIKVFSTNTSNFMAVVHNLTGIPSNVSPFHSNLPSPWAPNILPFNQQGLPTLDTSTMLRPSLLRDRVSSGSGYSRMQALPPQQQQQQVMKTASQAGQPLAANMECISSSYSDLMRSMCSSVNTSSLPRLWEASLYTSSKSGAHQAQQNSFSEKGGILTQEEPSHQDGAMEPSRSNFNTLSRLEMLLAGHDKLSSTTSSSALTSCVAKEERL